MASSLPVLYIPHGGGPCFFMNPPPGPPGTWTAMEAFLRLLPTLVGIVPRALLVVTAHWEESVCSVQGAERPGMLYDYYGFPDYTYELKYEAPGEPQLAERVKELLTGAGIQFSPLHFRPSNGQFPSSRPPSRAAFPEVRPRPCRSHCHWQGSPATTKGGSADYWQWVQLPQPGLVLFAKRE